MSEQAVWTEHFLREQLARVQERIAEHQAALRALHDEREHLRGILAGPRVQPMLGVWRHFSYDEEEVASIDDGMAMAEAIADSGNGAPVGVFVGGAFLPWDANLADCAPAYLAKVRADHRDWEAQERKETAR